MAGAVSTMPAFTWSRIIVSYSSVKPSCSCSFCIKKPESSPPPSPPKKANKYTIILSSNPWISTTVPWAKNYNNRNKNKTQKEKLATHPVIGLVAAREQGWTRVASTCAFLAAPSSFVQRGNQHDRTANTKGWVGGSLRSCAYVVWSTASKWAH